MNPGRSTLHMILFKIFTRCGSLTLQVLLIYFYRLVFSLLNTQCSLYTELSSVVHGSSKDGLLLFDRDFTTRGWDGFKHEESEYD